MMVERRIEQMTLRELFTDAERMTRELMEHLNQGFLPKAERLGRLVEPGLEAPLSDELPDQTVRHHAADLLESEQFTAELYDTLDDYLAAIDGAVSRILMPD